MFAVRAHEAHATASTYVGHHTARAKAVRHIDTIASVRGGVRVDEFTLVAGDVTYRVHQF